MHITVNDRLQRLRILTRLDLGKDPFGEGRDPARKAVPAGGSQSSTALR